MTYNEWRDELKSNLLCVSESERRRVLDYYAEAYADRRDAGFSEREIIEDFGAPYDAAQRILYEGSDGYFDDAPKTREPTLGDRRREERELREERRREERERRERERDEREQADRCSEDRLREDAPQPAVVRGDYTWLFVLLCIVFAFPIFMVIVSMVGVTIALCAAPFGALVSGIISIGTGIGGLFVNATGGAIAIGTGIIIFGVSLVLFPICFMLVKWMWKLFRMFFAFLKKAFSGEKARD